MVKIEFLDGSVKEMQRGITLAQIAEGISKSLRKEVIAGYVNDEIYDLTRPIEMDAKIKLIKLEDEEAEEIINHSAAHLLAHAVTRLYPGAKFGVGPAIEEGFYYDMDVEPTILENDLKRIEKEMNKIVSEAIEIERVVVSKQEALEIFKNDEYKVELIEGLDDQVITLYQQGEFIDLCRGAHVENTKVIKNFKLLSLAGAYWRGDSDNKMLQRIYGVAKKSKEALEAHLDFLEEARKRDHRKLGKELGLFMLSEYGPGFPFFLPKGMIVKDELLKYWHDVHKRAGYTMIQTPIMLNKELWEVSGHWFTYKENMYLSEIDKHEFAIKPMNCPGGILVYKNDIHSYRDFPMRVGELGIVHRHEASGALHGLFRVRCFTQDDAHLYITPDQIEEEVINMIKLFEEVYSTFGLTFEMELSTKPDNAIGSDEIWEKSEAALGAAATAGGYKFTINEGDGAFYGPKLDFKLKDSIGRVWQCGTCQLDMNLPERFDMTYIAADGSKQRPIMLHRTCMGSIERFMGILIEHYAGAFPTWLAPEQIKIIPVADVHREYANEINQKFFELGLRSSVEKRDEKLGYLIRDAQVNKIPYSLVIGDEEANNGKVTYRKYGSEEQVSVSVDEFIKLIQEDIAAKGK
ncbi:threonyl-tRNA synthetase [Bacilli bacterium PM5-3]|nr:threonyl-tRNA synthetase [Bacilli bacterium PM5-3]MDH6603509.1 threonyl-tRNA synthetase [Bacilli bacterium PM5-9]